MSADEIKFYIKKYVEKKTHAKVEKVDIISHYKIPDAKGWSVYFLTIKAKVKVGGKEQNAILNQSLFVKGDRITLKLIKKGKIGKNGKRKRDIDYSKTLKPKVPQDAYDREHLILGSPNAPHKIVFFSDPFCPYCKNVVIDIVNVVDKNPNIYGLYYYHLPLVRIHPASEMVSRAMLVFQKRGDIRNMLKLYRLLVEPEEKDLNKILEAIKQKTGVKLTKKDLYAKDITDALKRDLKMKERLQVTGTPTIFLDGMWDKQRNQFGKYAVNK
jgi:thiol-disulfide isomerase/thioredoxin